MRPLIQRHHLVDRMRANLERQGFPRLQMMLLVSLTGAVGFLASNRVQRAYRRGELRTAAKRRTGQHSWQVYRVGIFQGWSCLIFPRPCLADPCLCGDDAQ